APNTEVQHPRLGGIEVGGLLWKRLKGTRSRLLPPWLIAIAGRNNSDAQMLGIPLGQNLGVLRSKEESPNARYTLHVRALGSGRCQHTNSPKKKPPRSFGRHCCLQSTQLYTA